MKAHALNARPDERGADIDHRIEEKGKGMTLDEMTPGANCTLKDLTAEGALCQRLMDLGFYPGAKIRIVRNAPLVDPVELELDGYHVSIRHEEARHVEVE